VYGTERYSEISFWIFCYDELRPLAPALFLPYLFPDGFSPIATGREMFGFSKQLATYSYPSGQLNVWDPRFTATTTAWKVLSPDTQAQRYPFISLPSDEKRAVLELDAVAEKVWKSVDEAGAAIVKHFFGAKWTSSKGEVLGDVLNDFLRHCPAIFLKQFPAIEDAQQAEVRSITSAPFQLDAIHGGFPYLNLHGLVTFDLQFERLQSHPIVEELGLVTVASSNDDVDTVQAKGFWVNIDFGLSTGKTMESVPQPKQKIAVLGGGVGALSAAYGITQQPGWQDKYDITVYQLGWRLGGKGASGRNREIADRIEEHGLHIWFGYYDNAFKMIQDAYVELNRAPNTPLATWDMAFKPQSTIVVEEYIGEDEIWPVKGWRNWAFSFPPNTEVPGVGKARDDHPLAVFAELNAAAKWLEGEVRRAIDASDQVRAAAVDILRKMQAAREDAGVGGALDALLFKATHPLEASHQGDQAKPAGPSMEPIFAHFRALYEKLPSRGDDLVAKTAPLREDNGEGWLKDLRELLALVEQLLEPLAGLVDMIRRIITLLKLGVLVAVGVIRDWVWLKGYDTINKYDFTEWLTMQAEYLGMHNGAAVANSGLVRAFYDLYLGFPNGQNVIVGDGVAIGGNVAAGELLHSYVLVTLCYKGAIMWKMQAGMGDTVFTPLYLVLKQRGVRFEYFHKVTDLRLQGDEIGAIDVDVQATVKQNVGAYNPLYDVKGLACWPSTPLYEQLVEGEALRAQGIDLESSWSPWKPVAKKTLKLGVDFDQVVLGISVAALPAITSQLRAASSQWKAMLDNANTTQTQAMQLWLNVTLEETGWPLPSPILDAYGEPFNTWAQMNQTLDKESWPQNALPFGIAYFCNNMKDAVPIPPLSDHGFPERETQRVKEDARKWLEHYTGHLWPYATQTQGPEKGVALDWSKLVDLENRVGEARLDGQYFRANIDPTERYVCNAKGTNHYRLKAGGSGFPNLFLAGDWVDNGSLNLGCVESTVISGLQAARALTGGAVSIAHERIEGLGVKA
jgi:uncharacterized protein with NAD-binding domain and iron-sulfur cluster